MLYVEWCFVGIWIWSYATRMWWMSWERENMYRFSMRKGAIGLLEIWRTCRYGDMFPEWGIWWCFWVVISLCILAGTPPLIKPSRLELICPVFHVIMWVWSVGFCGQDCCLGWGPWWVVCIWWFLEGFVRGKCCCSLRSVMDFPCAICWLMKL